MHVPLSNNLQVNPSINYADFLESKFVVTDLGIAIPGKTDYAFRDLLLFHDGGDEEVHAIRKIKDILDVEARGVLDTLLFANVRDEESLMGLA